MGITSVFTEEVQLPGLKGDNLENICVSDVLHQTIIEVAERGVKAGAATGIIFKPIAPSKVTEFNVNKPFVYVIRDTKTNMIYQASFSTVCYQEKTLTFPNAIYH